MAAAPRPWWGDGDAPHLRWSGVALEIPCVWDSARERWQTPDGVHYFDAEAADYAEGFFPTMLEHHIGTEWNGRPFELLAYQAALVRAAFGWKRAIDGLRRFRKVFLAVPKGNGKSPFGAGLGLLLAFFDGEAGSEVYAVAADKKQAGIVFNSAKTMVERNTRWSGQLDVLRDSITARGSTECFQVLSSDASTKHGFRPHGIIYDEFHAAPDRELFETLYRGMGKRAQAMLVMITTAGDDDESICFEEWDYARRVLKREIRDDAYLPMIFELRPDEDWASVEALKRVNPGYGVTMKADYFETEIAAAQSEPRKRNSFIQLHGNRWTNQATAWLPVEWWDACEPEAIDIGAYQRWSEAQTAELRELPCAAGLDLAQKIDLACFSVVFRRRLASSEPVNEVEVVADEHGSQPVKKIVSLNYAITILPFFWIPEDTMKEREKADGVPYSVWREAGLVTATEGVTIDYTRIYDDIKNKILPRFPRLKQGVVGYDPAFGTDIAEDLRKGGLRTMEVLQNYTHMSEPCYTFEALIKAKRVRHGGHRTLRNHIEHTAVKMDDARRLRPVKPKKAGKHVDGTVASLMGLKMLAAVPDRKKSGGVMFV